MRYSIKIKIAICTILVVSLTTGIFGQMVMHFDKPYYVSGETIWYKAYFDNSIPEGSVLSVKVVSKDQDIVHDSFVKVKGHTVSGFFRIPYDIPSGNYVLVVEGKNSLAENVRVGEITVPIYNDIIQGEINYNNEEQPFSSYQIPTDLNVNISITDENLSPGELVLAQVSITDTNGNPVIADCSVSVADQGLIGSEEGIGIAMQDLGQPYNDLTNELFIEGKVYDSDGKAIQANVLGAYSSFDDRFTFTKSNSTGNFILPRSEFTGAKELQFLGYQSEHPVIMAKVNRTTTLNTRVGTLRYTEIIAKYLESSSKRKKINQYFKIRDKTNFIEDGKEARVEPQAQANYMVQEYQDFGIMSEFAKNLMMPLRFSGDKGERKAQVINPKSLKKANYYLSGDPLFIIDGKLTRNADYVGSMEQSEVVDLGIIFENKVLREKYNVMGSSGVVIINTTGRRARLPEEDERNIATVNGLQVKVDYPVSYNLGSEMNSLPVFEPHLYWNPEITTTGQGTAEINFIQSNDRSTWKIIVVARSKDGKIGVGTVDFNSQPAGE